MCPPRPERIASAHEGLVDLLRAMPRRGLLAIICPLIALDPAHIAAVHERTGPPELPALSGRARRVLPDLAVELHTHNGERIRVVILEVQLSFDATKRWTWPLLEVGLAEQCRTDAHLLVLTPNPELRRALRTRLFSRMPRAPLLIEADQITLIHDYTQARARPHEAVLGAVFHSREPHPHAYKVAALRAAYLALDTLEPLSCLRYAVVIMSIAPPALVNQALSELRSSDAITESRYELFSETERGGHSFHRGREEGREQGLEQGLEQGRGALRCVLLHLLERREFELSAQVLDRIESCTDPAILEHACRLASSLDSPDQLLALLEHS